MRGEGCCQTHVLLQSARRSRGAQGRNMNAFRHMLLCTTPHLHPPCLRTLPMNAAEDATRARYGPRVAKWMEYFNADQLMLMQYESLIAKGPSMAEDLQVPGRGG